MMAQLNRSCAVVNGRLISEIDEYFERQLNVDVPKSEDRGMKSSSKILENLDVYITNAMAEWDIPGLAIAVVKDDEIVFAKGFGVCELGKPDPVDENTIFAIASNTKAFTSTAIGLLVQEGKLDWDDLVIEHLPGFRMYDPYATNEITIRDLLCHRSGLQTWGGDLAIYGSNRSREEVVHKARYIKPSSSFRSSFGYTNYMFIVAGQIIATVSGSSWDTFIKKRILEPLSMTRSNTSINELMGAGNIAIPHEVVQDKITPLPYRNVDSIGPSGSINSTARDMAQWLRCQLNSGKVDEKQLIDKDILEETRIPHMPIPILPFIKKNIPTIHFLSYGLGWMLLDYHGHLVVRHTGGVDGMSSMVNLLPEKKLGSVVLSNKIPNRFVFALSYHVVDSYLGTPSRDWNRLFHDLDSELATQEAVRNQQEKKDRVKDTQLSLSLQEYKGVYKDQLYGDAAIEIRDGQLVLQLSGHPNISGLLEHWHYDTFMCQWTDPVFDQSLVPFILDGQGKVEKFRLKVLEEELDPHEYEFYRVSEDTTI